MTHEQDIPAWKQMLFDRGYIAHGYYDHKYAFLYQRHPLASDKAGDTYTINVWHFLAHYQPHIGEAFEFETELYFTRQAHEKCVVMKFYNYNEDELMQRIEEMESEARAVYQLLTQQKTQA